MVTTTLFMKYKSKTKIKPYKKSTSFNVDVEKLLNEKTKSSFQQEMMTKWIYNQRILYNEYIHVPPFAATL